MAINKKKTVDPEIEDFGTTDSARTNTKTTNIEITYAEKYFARTNWVSLIGVAFISLKASRSHSTRLAMVCLTTKKMMIEPKMVVLRIKTTPPGSSPLC